MNQEYKVHLSQGQKTKLAKAIKDGSALKLRLSKNSLSGPDELMLSPRQIAKLQKAKRNNSGVEISFSKSSIRKSVKQGGSSFQTFYEFFQICPSTDRGNVTELLTMIPPTMAKIFRQTQFKRN